MKAEPMDELASINRDLQVKLGDCDQVMVNLQNHIINLQEERKILLAQLRILSTVKKP